MKGPSLPALPAPRITRKLMIRVIAASLLLVASVMPLESSAQLQQGIRYYNQGYIQKAIPAFRQSYKANPANPDNQLWLARALIRQGGKADFKEAQDLLTRFLSQKPEHGEAMMLLGEMLGWNPQTRKQAITLLQGALERKGDYPAVGKKADTVTRQLVELLIWEGNYTEAARYAQPIKDTFASDRKWQATYALLLSRLGQPEEALALYENHIRPMDGGPLQWQIDYADALHRSGQKEKARSVFSRIQAKSDSRTPADEINALAGLAYELEEYEAAAVLNGRLPEAYRQRKDVRLRTARSLARLRRHPEAIEAFQQVYQSGAMRPPEKLEYGDYLLGLGLPSAVLPRPDLIESLFEETYRASTDPRGRGEISLRLARLYSSYGETANAFSSAGEAYMDAYRQLGTPEVRREMLDFLRSRRQESETAEALFRKLMAESSDPAITGAYAEWLSWQDGRRKEALEAYISLVQENPDQRESLQPKIEEVLGWHTPSANWVPIYNQVLVLYPSSRAARLAKARAYAGEPGYTRDAMSLYQQLRDDYPDDETISREWSGLLAGDEDRRDEAMASLKSLVEQNPADLDARVAYAKLLSYEGDYRKALEFFDSVLETDPQHREALVGKGYTLIWSGKRYRAKKLLEEARQRYPDDVSVALALAAAEKSIGRNDKALQILNEIRPLLNWQDQGPAIIFCQDERLADDSPYSRENLIYDFAMPARTRTPIEPATPKTGLPVQVPFSAPSFSVIAPPETPKPIQPEPFQPEIDDLARELDTLQSAISSLNAVQTQSGRQLDRLKTHLWDLKHETVPELTTLHHPVHENPQLSPNTSILLRRQYAQGMGVYDEDLFAGQGGRFSQEIRRLEDDLFSDLRPELRAGYAFQFQEGEPTTNELFSWGFPNQMSLSLTPQLRLRGGIVPRRYYLPNATIRPRSTYGILYTLGATAKYWDRVTLDGDFGITHFTQSDHENITWRAQAKIDIIDEVSLKVGGRRQTLPNSLLSVAGFRPSAGAFRGDVLGPANENAFYTELNILPFRNVDLNLGYEWAVVTGSKEMPANYKNQFFTSVGYTHRFNAEHSARLGYEFLFFTFSKNTTNGFFDVESGVRRPLAVLRPPIPADSGYDYGGYFSPSRFFLNAFRLDYRGAMFNRFLEYELGGSLGVQAFEHGFGIQDSDPTSLASAFNIALKMNFTDWLAAYGRTDFLDSGGLFSRWRFEGGLIVRPNIRSLSPVFGGS